LKPHSEEESSDGSRNRHNDNSFVVEKFLTILYAVSSRRMDGCPVIGSAVDGIPEVIVDDQTGRCIRPTLPMKEYASLGGGYHQMPGWYYDPASDSLETPKLVSPEEIADAVRCLCAAPDDFQRMSVAAREQVARKFDFGNYVRTVNGLLVAFADGARGSG